VVLSLKPCHICTSSTNTLVLRLKSRSLCTLIS
jgi:hypothetical protein